MWSSRTQEKTIEVNDRRNLIRDREMWLGNVDGGQNSCRLAETRTRITIILIIRTRRKITRIIIIIRTRTRRNRFKRLTKIRIIYEIIYRMFLYRRWQHYTRRMSAARNR